ncbi:alpha-L-fucosidase [Halegenticoccus tardaugens]|uniref:alpha-L-fucosidase n=1 Tax=Halegenticoccus tardaugens TaxID=2071624 RepID=UPI00100BF298|nr:alpha-L-fucosidase [Halegenticoccus tardaugens]
MTIETASHYSDVTSSAPSYLDEYEQQYEEDPRQAAREWFADAKYGLFLHYGLYSLLSNHEWVQYHERIEPANYAQLQHHFTAESFDAEHIVEFAQDCGMNYITFTARHHEGFCLFESDYTTYSAVEAPAGRDLVAELSDSCQEAGLGLFLYYSHGYDWHHPHAPNRDEWGDPVRPAYDEQPGCYADAGHDLDIYLDYLESQVEELLTQYGPIAGIWLDPSYLPQRDPERFAKAFHLESLYKTVRDSQPQTLISYKEGVTGTEDFVTPEHETGARDVLGEVCTTMIPGEAYRDEMAGQWGYGGEGGQNQQQVSTSWGYAKAAEGIHRDADEVWEKLSATLADGYNLLLNVGPLPDGRLDPEDVETLRAVGDRIECEGYPD